MAVSDTRNIIVYRELGLVSQVFNEATLSTLQGNLGIGHTRYSTTGSTTWENAQPAFKTDGSLFLLSEYTVMQRIESGRVTLGKEPTTAASQRVSTVNAS